MTNIWDPPSPEASLPAEQAIEIQIEGQGGEARVDPVTGAIEIDTPDGGVEIELNPSGPERENKFGDNLAEHLGEGELSGIAEDLLQGIGSDEQSRAEWISSLERAIELLGVKLEQPKSDAGQSSAPLEGQSTCRHPVLLEAVLRAQATAAGELLPAAGPVKCEVEGGNNSPARLARAEALESDLNDYLVNRAPEYYPDTRRSLFWSSLTGAAFKKVYSCPIRQRPVSESVDAKDFIVASFATDLRNATRKTHRIMMAQSVMKRMQVAGAYLDIPLGPPTSSPSALDEKEAQTEGISLRQDRPEDKPYTVYESYCELDLDQFAPSQFKGKAIPLPYVVTIEKDSRVILEIRRNWVEDDDRCLEREVFVKYPYVEGMGLYGLGLLHILGNSAAALTAAWRLMLDNGMFANFPGGVVDKSAARQLTNQFKIPPGGMVQLDFGGRPANQVYGQLPYRDLGPVWVSFIQQMESAVQRLGGAAEIDVGEGKQDAPVGTTLALIEQAAKIESEVHKGQHTAQASEFRLLAERFKEDPAAFWRHIPRSKTLALMIEQYGLTDVAAQEEADEQQRNRLFVEALSDVQVVPQADPNSPSHVHRMMRWQGLKQLQMSNPNIDQNEVDKIGVRLLGYDPEQLWSPPSAEPPPPDPKVMSAQAQLMMAQAKLLELQHKSSSTETDAQIEQQKLQVQQRIAELQVIREQIIHQNDMQLKQAQLQSDNVNRHLDRSADMQKHRMGLLADQQKQRASNLGNLIEHHTALQADRYQHDTKLSHDMAKHVSGLHADATGSDLARRAAEQQADADRRHQMELAELAAKAAKARNGNGHAPRKN